MSFMGNGRRAIAGVLSLAMVLLSVTAGAEERCMVSSALGLTYTTPKMYNRRYGRETSQVQFVLFYNFYNYGYKRANGRDAE